MKFLLWISIICGVSLSAICDYCCPGSKSSSDQAQVPEEGTVQDIGDLASEYENYQFIRLGYIFEMLKLAYTLTSAQKVNYQTLIDQARQDELIIGSDGTNSFLGVVKDRKLIPVSDLGMQILEAPDNFIECARYLYKNNIRDINTTLSLDEAKGYFDKLMQSINGAQNFLDQYTFVRISRKEFQPYLLVLPQNHPEYSVFAPQIKFAQFYAECRYHDDLGDFAIVFGPDGTKYFVVKDYGHIIQMVLDLGNFDKSIAFYSDFKLNNIGHNKIRIESEQIKTTEDFTQAKEYLDQLVQGILTEKTLKYSDVKDRSLIIGKTTTGIFSDAGFSKDNSIVSLDQAMFLCLKTGSSKIDYYQVLKINDQSWIIVAYGQVDFRVCHKLDYIGVSRLPNDAKYCVVQPGQSKKPEDTSFGTQSLNRFDFVLLQDSQIIAVYLGDGYIQYVNEEFKQSRIPVQIAFEDEKIIAYNYKNCLFAVLREDQLLLKHIIDIDPSNRVTPSRFGLQLDNTVAVAFKEEDPSGQFIVILKGQQIQFVSTLGFRLNQAQSFYKRLTKIDPNQIRTTKNFQKACDYYNELKKECVSRVVN